MNLEVQKLKELRGDFSDLLKMQRLEIRGSRIDGGHKKTPPSSRENRGAWVAGASEARAHTFPGLLFPRLRSGKAGRVSSGLLDRATFGSGPGVQDGREEARPATIAAGEIDFPLDAADAVKKKLTNVGQGGARARGHAIGSDQAKEAAEDLIDVVDRIESACSRDEGGDDPVGLEDVLFLAGVEEAEGGVGWAAEHGAAAAVGERKSAAGWSRCSYLARRIRVRGFHGSS
jgi:hypothetical protein